MKNREAYRVVPPRVPINRQEEHAVLSFEGSIHHEELNNYKHGQ